MKARSTLAHVRNPVLALPAFAGMKRILDDHPAVKAAVVQFLREMSTDARFRAEKCWRTHKAPMALYWKCVAVYTGHIARGLMSNERNEA